MKMTLCDLREPRHPSAKAIRPSTPSASHPVTMGLLEIFYRGAIHIPPTHIILPCRIKSRPWRSGSRLQRPWILIIGTQVTNPLSHDFNRVLTTVHSAMPHVECW